MKRITMAAGVAVAGAMLALSAQAGAQAAPLPQTTVAHAAAVTPSATQGDWNPPAGYTLERSFLGDSASCSKEGDAGVAAGKWHQYVCHEQMMKLTDTWMLFQFLYVQK
ncbi:MULTISPECIES: hypothetical protein [Streptomyces]|uniref:Uncharacterized protein n=2 Tax=Streptomyces TaxID=1883 RepID=A0A2N8P546_STRNR|nr:MULTISPECIES: hypothetical protein [Streptomyces]PNE36145.1 hypothetical protein AOB60_39120 [Streptomyces noursei]SHL65338.1 hypothetical protein SAMN05216268_105372 [Streptomyces yunnanensis]